MMRGSHNLEEEMGVDWVTIHWRCRKQGDPMVDWVGVDPSWLESVVEWVHASLQPGPTHKAKFFK
jgi:hypothetical protein